MVRGETVDEVIVLPGVVPGGGILITAAIGAINYGYLLFGPVRQARARLKQVERAVRARSARG